MLALFIKTILFRHFIFVSYLNDFNQFLNITERRGDLKGLVKLAYTLCEAHILHFLKQLADYLYIRAGSVLTEQMVSLFLQFYIQTDLFYQMTLAELVSGGARLVVTLKEIQIVEPLGEAFQLLLYGLPALSYAREIEIAIPRFELQTYLTEVIRVVIQILLNVIIQMSDS